MNLPPTELALPAAGTAAEPAATPAGAGARELPREVAAALARGQTFAGYVLVKPLGQGGSGTVHLAWQQSLGRYVALKILHQAAPDDVQRFLREVEVEASLSHPNIVPIYDVGEHDGRPFLAMKYVAGKNLADVKLPVERAVALMRDVAGALAYAHARGIVHRDLKPPNLMLDEDGHVWVMDFGLARPIKGGATLTVAGHAVGTPAYMPPEQARGQRCDPRSDVYALGATLYDLLTGRPPFIGTKPVEVMIAVLRTEPIPLRQLVPTIPSELEAIVQKAMDKAPARRYETAAALGEDLRRFLGGETVLARPAGLVLTALKWATRHPVASAAAVVTSVALIVLVVGAGLYVANVTRARTLAEKARTAAELKLAQSLVSQGDALGLAGRWSEAQARYTDARTTFVEIGESPRSAELGMVSAYQNAPPPLQSYEGQHDRIAAVVISPDGGRALSASEDKTVRLWDVASGREIGQYVGHTDGVWALALSSDGRRFATGSWDGTVRLWDGETGRTLRTIARDGAKVHAVALSPDDKVVAAGYADGTATLWDAGSGLAIHTLGGHTNRVRSVAFSPDGNTLATASWDSSIRIWHSRSGALIRTIQLGDGYVFSVTFSPDGKRLVAGSSNQRIWIWDVATGKLRQELRGHTGFVSQVVLSRDGRRAFSAGWDGTVRSWNLDSGAEERILVRGPLRLYAIAPTPDERAILAAGEKGSLHLWDAGALAPSVLSGHTAPVRAVAISPDGLVAASGGQDRRLVLWDIASGRALRTMSAPQPVEAVAFTPDGRGILATGAGGADLWDVASGRKLRTVGETGRTVRSISMSADGRLVLLGTNETVSVWEFATGAQRKLLSDLEGLRRAAALPDGNTALVSHQDGRLSLFDLANGKQRWTLPRAHDGNVNALAITADGRRALSGATDNLIKLWNLSDGRLLKTLSGHTGLVRSVAFAPDGRWAASSSEDHTVRLWDLETAREIRSFIGHEGRVLSVAVTPDAHAMISVGADTTVRMWDFSLGAQLFAYAERLPKLRATLAARADDAPALAELGQWFIFRGACQLAAQVTERARQGGETVRALPLARCYRSLGQLAGAKQELARAVANHEAPRPYLDLLQNALAERDVRPVR